MNLHNEEAIILHRPHNVEETVKLISEEDVMQYIRNTSGIIAYGNKKERIQQATNLKAIIYWLLDAINKAAAATVSEEKK